MKFNTALISSLVIILTISAIIPDVESTISTVVSLGQSLINAGRQYRQHQQLLNRMGQYNQQQSQMMSQFFPNLQQPANPNGNNQNNLAKDAIMSAGKWLLQSGYFGNVAAMAGR